MSDDPQGPQGGRPPLNEALRLLAEQERRSLGEHPTPEELAAYRNGELTEPDADRIRDHLALCHDCADLLLNLADLGQLKPPAGVAPASEEEVDRAWASLRSRIGELEGAKTPTDRSAPVVPLRAVPPAMEPRRRRDWRMWALAASLIAVLSWGVVGQSKLSELQTKVQELSAPRAGGLHIDLKNEAMRGAGKVEKISSEMGGYLDLYPEDQGETEEYEAEIVDQGSKAAYPIKHIPAEEPSILIPGGALKPGRYEISLFGMQGGRRTPAGVFPLQVDAP